MARTKSVVDDAVDVSEEKEEVKTFTISKSKKELLMEKLKPFMDEEAYKIVKGRFKNYECPGAAATITCQKYPGVPVFKKNMTDDNIYEIPLYVARFLNGIDITAPCRRIDTCSYAIHGFKWEKDENAPPSIDGGDKMIPALHVAKRVRRYGFESLAFDTEE